MGFRGNILYPEKLGHNRNIYFSQKNIWEKSFIYKKVYIPFHHFHFFEGKIPDECISSSIMYCDVWLDVLK